MIRKIRALTGKLGTQSVIGVGMTILGLLGAASTVLLEIGFPFGAFLLLSLVGEILITGSGTQGARLLRRASLGYTTRIVARLSLALIWLIQSSTPLVFGAGLALAIGLIGVRSADVLAAAALRRRHATSIAVANINIEKTELSPHPLLTRRELFRGLPSETLVLVGVVGAYWNPILLLTSAAGLIFGLVLIAMFVRTVRTLEAAKTDSITDPNIQRVLDDIAPKVVLYFSGNAASVYQVNMWLSTMERLELPALIVLRERSVFDTLAVTSTPVMCVPNATELMNIDFSSVRVALYPVNVGKNIHFLRLPHIKSVFIGHGDSDKSASFNPYSRVYDEIWVAGPAGRERYRRAQIGVTDEAIKEVGRPQIVDLAKDQGTHSSSNLRTLLYAPTWEGWNEDQNYCSIESIGLPLIKRILSEKLPIRIIFRPHPFTGTRLNSVSNASKEIEELLKTANTGLGIASVEPPQVPAAENAVQSETVLAERDDLYLEKIMAGGHVTLPAKWGTAMSSCMISADAMLTDVSSVLSDFLATDKPYATANPSQATEEQFVTEFPATAGGFVMTPDPASPGDFLDVLLGTSRDTYIERRMQLRSNLLGASPEAALEGFNLAVENLAHVAEERLARIALSEG